MAEFCVYRLPQGFSSFNLDSSPSVEILVCSLQTMLGHFDIIPPKLPITQKIQLLKLRNEMMLVSVFKKIIHKKSCVLLYLSIEIFKTFYTKTLHELSKYVL